MGRAIKSTRLNGKHTMAMAMLAKGTSVKEVAKIMHVTPDTIYTWQKWPEFQQAQENYVASVARAELDRGIQDATVELHESTQEIVRWMKDVVLGTTILEAKDHRRWKMALDLLHHAGIIDKQAAMRSNEAATAGINLTLDQRRQSILATGNQELQRQLERFNPPESN